MIYNIKTGFDAEFEALHRQKMQEVINVRERNKDIRRIMEKLDMRRELWEPSLTDSEQPEGLFTVDDSEVTNTSSNMKKKKKKKSGKESWTTSCKTKRYGSLPNKVLFQKANAEFCTFCLIVDKSREVPHPRAERGGGEEEVGSAKTFGCPSIPPQLMCSCFEFVGL